MARRISRFVLWGGLLAGLTLLAAGCGGPAKPVAADVKKLAGPITVTAVQMAPAERYYETAGTVKAHVVSKVAPKIMGAVTAVYVQSGDLVQAGQVLAELADTEIRQQVAAAEAGYREADKGLQLAERNRALQAVTYERYETLYRQAAISRQQVDEIRTQHELAQLAYEQAMDGRDRAGAILAEAKAGSRLVAPVSGVVTEKNLEIGNMVQAGVPVVTVEDNRAFLVECYVAAGSVDKVQPGMAAWFDTAGGRTIAGTVKEVVPAVDVASRSALVKVSLAGRTVKTGEYGKVRFLLDRQNMLSVPQTAVIAKGQLTGVYVLDGQERIWYRLVRLGRQYGSVVEIISGLQDGDLVVTGGMEYATDGALAGEVNRL